MRAIEVATHGGPENLQVVDIERPAPGAGEVLVEVRLSGVNFLDVYQRVGGTPVSAPFLAGVEGMGVIAERGPDVVDLDVGRRIGWLAGGQGSFADFAVVDAGKAVVIPDDVSDESAVAVLMQGVTAHYLATDTYPIERGDTVLIHAAAGGVGQMLTQIAKLKGATVIGTVSTEEKAAVARGAGADHVVGYDDFPSEVERITGGTGVAAVYDGVGAATFDGSLASLAVRGTYVVFGTSSGPTPPLDIPRLNSGGSLFVTRPSVVHHVRTPDELRARARDLFAWLASGDLVVSIGGRYPVEEASDAFSALESRETTGKILLTH
ncbi:quinone oxidoreductase family protein [Gordonia humi]|uniref:NADPH2:quinone reductase n=1 Tax=Gordonia humi TaxID=686429 RepID=A0A840F8P2_9ACTN|nr:quinone oxidoreductase [Gordonia humi]MBB4137959.1 NADPH2:quinone reductase [Gordonia humi]